MAERTLIIDHLKFSYEGLFNFTEFYQLIQDFFYEKGWDWYEKLNQEQVTSSGKQIKILFEPWKSVSDYYKLQTAIRLHITDMKEVEVEHKNESLRLNQGVIRITFDGYVLSDRHGKWTTKPFFWFLSILFNKYVFKDHFEKFATWIKSDIDDLHGKIKNYLNVFKYTYQT
jgi:hypothetical protein